MKNSTRDEDHLKHRLLTLPQRSHFRYTDAVDRDLRQLLFHSLARQRQDYLRLFFPQGLPTDQSRPWSLREAQGAVDGAEYLPSAKGTACGHIFKSGESTYSCKTCAADDTCVLCSRCFESSDHDDHQVYVSVSPGNSGCCDCGDKEAWRRDVKCSIHTEDAEEDVRSSGKEKAAAPLGSQLPPDLMDAIRMTVSRAVDYLCDVFSCSPEQLRLPKTEQSIREDESKSRLSSAVYGAEDPGSSDTEFAVMLWNDEKHTVTGVQNQVAKACKASKTYGLTKAYEVNDKGRAIVHYSTDVAELVQIARVLEQIKVTVTVRSSRDTFREQMCETMIDWMSDIAGCAVGNEAYLLRNVVCEEFLRPWRMGSEASNKDIGQEGIDDHEIDESMKLRKQYAAYFRPQMQGVAFVRVETESDDDDEEILDDEDDEDVNLDDLDADDEDDQMEVEIDEIHQAANTALQADADMDIDLLDEADDGHVMEAAMAGYPPPPPPPPPTAAQQSSHRQRILTPTESEDGDAEPASQSEPPPPATNAPFDNVPKTPRQKVVTKRLVRPSRHWLEKPKGYRNPRPSEPAEDLWQRVRLDWLILYDLRLWKTLRIKLRHMYITNVATIPHFKRILGLRFAGLYTPLAELYLVADREPDHSIINLSVQMLTTPSITEEVVERGNFLTNLMAILYTFLTTRQVGFPENVSSKATLAFDAGSVTNRRMFHFFVDMRWLFQSEFIQHKMRTETQYILQFLDLVKLHQGICPNFRATGEHVEYESDAWISASLIIKDVDRLCKAAASSFDVRSPEADAQLRRVIRIVAQVTMINSFGYERKRFGAHENRDDMPWHEVGPFDDSGKTFGVPKFIVQSEWISFHHPLHYLLSWLFEHAKYMSRKDVRALLHFAPADVRDPYNDTRGQAAPKSLTYDELMCSIFDHPLRLCAWLSQMKAGMWVRNGITLRHQAHTYRSVSHRDISYQRDIFMIQAGLTICGTEHERPGERFLAQMVDRFQMTQWMKGDYSPPRGFEEAQQIDVLEDLYHLLIIALSERGNLLLKEDNSDVPDRVLQHDIAHALCFKPLSFSDLNTRVTEKIADSDSFQRVLEDMTVYRAPEGLSDTGTFELKQEFVPLVDPYYAHYSRNHREEADLISRQYIARKTGKNVEDVVFEPQLQKLDGSLFSGLPAVTKTRLFAIVIAAALQYAIVAKTDHKLPATRIETFLHMVLHLALIGVLEDDSSTTDGFVEIATSTQHKLRHGTPWTIVSMLIVLSEMADYSTCLPAIKHLLRKMQLRQPEKLSTAIGPLAASLDRSNTGSPASVTAEDKEKKKQEAMARQARVMAQMKQQQNSFLQNQGLAGFDDDFDDIGDDMSLTQEPESIEEQRKTWAFPVGTCILCQEETDDQRLYGTFAFVGESNILRSTPVDDPDFVQEVLEIPTSLDRSAEHQRPFGVAGKNKQTIQKATGDGKTANFERQGLSKGFPHAQHSTTGPVSTTCGHIMHYSCFELYLAATQRRQHQQIARSHPETIANKEFICPLCKALGNTFLPIVWKSKECVHEHELHAAKNFEDWLANDTASYEPDMAFLKGPGASVEYTQRAFAQGVARSSQYVNGTYMPSLAAALQEASIGSVSRQPAEESHFQFRRALSLGSLFGRNSRSETAQSVPDVQSSLGATGSESQPRLGELVKAYQRVDETIRANNLNGAAHMDVDILNPVSPLARSLGFSISAVEIQQRGMNNNALSTSLVAELPEQTLTHLRIMSETTESYLAVNILHGSQQGMVAKEVLTKRDVMASQLFGTVSEIPMIHVREFAGGLLFEDDVFLFLSDWLAFNAPTVSEALSILQMCYWAEIVKVIFMLKSVLRKGILSKPEGNSVERTQLADTFVRTVQAISAEDTRDPYGRVPHTTEQLQTLRALIERYAQTFLRKSIVLMHVRYGLDFECPYDIDPSTPELDRLTRLLHISTIDSLCTTYTSRTPPGAALQRISKRWLSQAATILEHPHTRIPIKIPHPSIFELVGLPKNYDVLTEEAIKRKCPTTGKEISDPAVCLFCAAIFCSQATCCMKGPEHDSRGGCWQHMQKCGGHIGIFINIRKCMVLFLHEPMHGSFSHAPYLDRHGEPDPTLRRHHQLFLNQRRYDKLMRDVWLGHGVQTFISRKLEADINPGGWETL